jgi:hypothetical protein
VGGGTLGHPEISALFGQAEIPDEHKVLALGVANNALAVTPELRIVRGKQKKTGHHSRAEIVDEAADLGVTLDIPVGSDRAEIDDSDMATGRLISWGFGHRHQRTALSSAHTRT